MESTFKKIKKKWWILAAIIAILLVAFLFIRTKYVSPIYNIVTGSINPNEIYIRWKDDKDDLDETKPEKTILYTVYWSNKPGIKPHDPKTYTGSKLVSGNEFKLKTTYDVVYITLSKKGRKTNEFEIMVLKDQRFTVNNLQPVITTSNIDVANTTDDISNNKSEKVRFMNVRVLQDAELYHLYQKSQTGETIVQDFDVYNRERIEMRLPSGADDVVKNDSKFFYLSYQKDGIESDPVFLLYDEHL